MSKINTYLIILFFFQIQYGISQTQILSSPDENIKIEIQINDEITWSVGYQDKIIVETCTIALALENQVLGQNPKFLKQAKTSIDQIIKPVIPHKNSEIQDYYNELTLSFEGDYQLIFRAYDNGIAYKFSTNLEEEIIVKSERMDLKIPQESTTFFPEEDSLYSHYERYYKKFAIKDIQQDQICSLPVLFQTPEDINLLITEADLYDYPCLFFFGQDNGTLKADFPKVVKEAINLPEYPDRSQIITKEADYIAQTSGKRDFPWRVFMITDEDKKLVENNLVFQLSRPLALENTDWIQAGKVAWDWWNANNIYGVDFESGINTKTYKYYIDFASKYGLEYIILDEGWSKTTTELTSTISEIDLPELIRYGKEKNVGIILWVLWRHLDKDLGNILDLYQSWGVKGIKVDFMQRADQEVVKFYERVAKVAGERELLVDFHGAFKPSGLRRAYPNVLSYEGVNGLEQCKWSDKLTPTHNVTLPFIRMVAGPMDYTPGAMDNAQEENYAIRFERPMSLGTRCHQLAMYVVYESPLQMLSDNPSNYYKEPECTKFISKIPVTWEGTKVLEGKIGEYILIARKNSENWYIGGMTNWDERSFQLDLSFLEGGKYEMEIMQDGINAEKDARDYKKSVLEVDKNSKINIKMASGGGWVAILKKL